MPVEYRAMRAGEEEAVLDLWSEVWGKDGRGYFVRYFAGDPERRPEHTVVAVENGGLVVSAVHVCMRYLRDDGGVPRRVGCVANVATRKQARRQGHSGRLLELSIRVMDAETCAGSLLYSGVNRHYERFGWRILPTSSRHGTLDPRRGAAPARRPVRILDPDRRPEEWDALSKVYDDFNAHRPLSVVRTPAYWRGFGARAFTGLGALVLTTAGNDGSDGVASYLLAHLSARELRLHEIGWRPGDEASVFPLIATAADQAAARGVQNTAVHLPSVPEVEATLERVLTDVTVIHHHGAMVREIPGALEPFPFEAAFAAPGAIFWSADGF